MDLIIEALLVQAVMRNVQFFNMAKSTPKCGKRLCTIKNKQYEAEDLAIAVSLAASLEVFVTLSMRADEPQFERGHLESVF